MSHENPEYPEGTVQAHEALYNDRLGRIFSLYQEHGIDARLIGSLGIAASLLQAPTAVPPEFGGFKDIDIIVLGTPPQTDVDAVTQQAKAITFPINLDEHFKNQVTLGEHEATIRYKEIIKNVDPKVFALRQGVIAGTVVPTFDPNTHFHLPALYGFMTPKEFRSLRQLARNKQHAESLDEDLFQPFHELNKERERTYPFDQLVGHLRWCYQTNVPVPIRRRLTNVGQPIWRATRRHN